VLFPAQLATTTPVEPIVPAASVAVIDEPLFELIVASVPPKVTEVAPEKLEPLMVIMEPAPPQEEEILVIVGTPGIMEAENSLEEMLHVFLTVTVEPEAPAGTINVMLVLVLLVKVVWPGRVPPKRTAEALEKFEPVMVRVEPGVMQEDDKLVITGSSNSTEVEDTELPQADTLMVLVVTPAGTTAWI